MVSCANFGMLLKSWGSSETPRSPEEGAPHAHAQRLGNRLLVQIGALFLVDPTLMFAFACA